MKPVFGHIRQKVIRGILALIPLYLTYLALRLLYTQVDQRVSAPLERMTGFALPGLGLLIVVAALYLIGLLAGNVLGRQLFRLTEHVTSRIPLLGTTYKVGKQLADTLSLPEREMFRRVVLVPFLHSGVWTVGFVTGQVRDLEREGERLLKVFVPTPPNPASGTMVLVPESDTRDPGWTVEEALRAVISGGIIGPPQVGRPPAEARA